MMIKPPEVHGPQGRKYRVGILYCIGRNYRKHAQEMDAPVPEHPIVFSKSASAFTTGPDLHLPEGATVHHELEIVALMGKPGRNIPASSAWESVAGLALGLDLTLRDLQAEFKSQGLPWFRSKSFHQSAVLTSVLFPDDPRWEQPFWLEIDNQRVQEGKMEDMLFSIPELIADISEFSAFFPGDMIYTGTPEGVGPLKVGQELRIGIGKDELGRYWIR